MCLPHALPLYVPVLSHRIASRSVMNLLALNHRTFLETVKPDAGPSGMVSGDRTRVVHTSLAVK